MERLTEKRDGQNIIPLRQNGKQKWSLCSAGMGDVPTQFLYGDHADKLAEYEYLEEQGLLLKLPCKVGDKVWTITTTTNYSLGEYPEVTLKKPQGKKIQSITITKIGFLYHVKGKTYCKYDFGKTVFLTQAEAEEALKRMEEKGNE